MNFYINSNFKTIILNYFYNFRLNCFMLIIIIFLFNYINFKDFLSIIVYFNPILILHPYKLIIAHKISMFYCVFFNITLIMIGYSVISFFNKTNFTLFYNLQNIS